MRAPLHHVRVLPLLATLLLAPPTWGQAASSAPYRLGPEAPLAPQRVVTLAPSLTEVVLDLGLGARLVGVTRYDDAKEVEGLPRVGGFLDPSAERILALRPDLLVVQPSPGNRGVIERLAKLGVPVLVVPLENLQEIQGAIASIAEALGEAEAGRALQGRIRSGLHALSSRAAAAEKVDALVVYGWSPLVVAGPGSYADELLALVGGQNAAASMKGAFPTLPHEVALAMNPTVVIDATAGHGGGAPPLGWKDRTHAARSEALARPGPRVIEAAAELSRLLHGPPTKRMAR
jgi:iron complex transport system substrate-binding protein